jgi:predicted DNA-binding transcriptional regulator AlpA
VNDWPSHLPIYLGFRDEIVTAIDIGRRLGVSNQRVHQLVGQGQFPRSILTFGRSHVWRRDDVDAWIDRRCAADTRDRRLLLRD